VAVVNSGGREIFPWKTGTPSSGDRFILDDTIIEKAGKKISDSSWYKDLDQNLSNVLGHQWVDGLLYKQAFLHPGSSLYPER